ncbi:helix-turn-helix transcriptional regulator [Halomonas sp. TRM85114]|uniref:helix-turn-helix transcriptional regulator n=1 Tax=Halomonas jincaotanensis TaxID=2810616 RepID=UPI001BD53724|nr:helix-turn-helix transcriptional regulator [Halomonas jincaotanensis]MBS9402282.1 helix-turn-helix transcriptional regulator [Halomonas jincaotanensis]
METERRHLPDAYLTTVEVADYLRLKERKVYDLVRQGEIPCVRITGKLLFPKQSIDLWLMNHLEGDRRSARPVPTVLAGSQDPLLEWAVRESGADLAMLCHGSGDGVRRLIQGDAMVVGLHLVDAGSGTYNVPTAIGLSGMRDLVMIRWAVRQQGLLLAPGNPLGIACLEDLAREPGRIAHRQPDAGAHRLLEWLLARAGVEAERLRFTDHPSLSEDDLALAIRQGEADSGLGVEAAARRQGLDFVPLHEEHFDLAMRRRSYFEPPVQRLLAFASESRFVERAEALGGYDVSELGRVIYNA